MPGTGSFAKVVGKFFESPEARAIRPQSLLRRELKSEVMGEPDKKEASAISDKVIVKLGYLHCKKAQLSPEELKELTEDIHRQLNYFGGDEASQVLPGTGLKEDIEQVERGGKPQLLAGLGGGVLGAGVGSGFAALTSRIATGRVAKPYAIGSAVPGAILGFSIAKNLQRQKELGRLLKERFGNE
jgi:hypothetical protein